MHPIRILFVCLGNICRSPAAEAAFLHAAKAAGRDAEFVVDSAGTGGWHIGQQADPRMRAAGTRRGIAVTSIVRKITRDDFEQFDYVFAMDTSNLRDLRDLAPPKHHGKIRLYREMDPEGPGQDVPDPYYGDTADFEHVLDIVTRTAREWLGALTRT